MNKQNSISEFLFGLAIFVGLMPLAFTFSQNETQLLLFTSFKYIVWSGQAIILLLLLLAKIQFSRNKLIGMGVLFLLIPFVFTFSESGVSFLILNQYPSSVLSWAIASVLFSKIFFSSNFKPSH